MSTAVLDDYEAVAYIITGADLAITIVSLLQCFRVFPTNSKGLKYCLWAIIAQFCSTLVTFTGGYWATDSGAELTTLDGFLYPQMVLATFLAYSERVVTLDKNPHLNKYAKMIPAAIFVLLIPDVISYILGAWVDTITDEERAASISAFSDAMLIIDQIVFIFCNFALYYMLLSKMSKFLTVRKIKILQKVIGVVTLLVTLDVLLAIFALVNLDMYNAGYNLNFSIKLACVLHFFDEKSWMYDILNASWGLKGGEE